MINRQHKRIMNFLTRMLIPGVLFVAIGACRNDPEQIKLLTGDRKMRDDRAHDITAIYSKKGTIKARLFAKEYIKNEAARPPYTDLNTNIRVEFYNDSEQLEHVLTADSCRYYETKGNILVWGNVQIVSTKGEQLNTEELVWNQDIQRFFTEKPVKITTPSEVLYGKGMEANQDFTWYQITNPTGTVQVKKGEVPN